MQRVTIIFTAHSEIGNCNSDALYQILETINPDVIFEEISEKWFDKAYSMAESNQLPLEVKCIRKYIQNHIISHIPVDIETDPNITNQQIEFMFNSFKKYNAYSKLEDEENIIINQDGFAFLNSKRCSELFKAKKDFEQGVLGFGSFNNQLSQIYKLFHEEQERRENAMLENIIKFSSKNQFTQAVFLIGSGHRNSIHNKITALYSKVDRSLNWAFYNEL